ncbi:hypothetical protein KBI23_05345 [bacterium]|nr:hypothetical protein [bacterium]MBP9807910.1 hypothetical protein [bacterium]
MFDKDAKLQALAELIEGKIVDDTTRVEACIKGTVIGFPATIEALKVKFPFGCSFFLETDVLNENKKHKSNGEFTLTISHRIVTGFWAKFSRILLVDHSDKPLGLKRFDSEYIAQTNNDEEALRFVQYPSMIDKLLLLSQYTNFTELHIRSGYGVVLVQPTSIEKLDIDTARETFRVFGEVAQVVFEAF